MTWDLVAAATGRVVEAWLLRFLLAFSVGIIMWRVAALSRRAFERTATKSGADPNVRLLTGRLLYGAVLLLALVWILGIVGLDPASILATFGVFGLALSLAAQDILKSFFAGL